MCLSLRQYLSFTDNARDAVLLHVSASSEGQERRNKTGAMMKETECHILTHRCLWSFCLVLLYSRTSGSASYLVY